ncbi:SRPBCC domain-containing protein [Streptomyces sp. NBC_00247]|uniref:SRPBCC domain-containing protein n=1 Tax=Streptomyces sp. NBC_00247 TaxID=2975689 RepID=UPI002E291792|nr:SRPBCC domain-containing protein [Streptomyces sp. NBC_00247]
MEHEVFVPVPVASLRSALGDPARVARCVPSLQQDAGASEALAGRLRFRVDGHTITYRGALELTATDEYTVSVTGEGAAARGAGSVKLALTITLDDSAGGAAASETGCAAPGAPGTTIRYTGTATGDGRLAELDAEAVHAAARRLLDRFTQQLVTESLGTHETPEDHAAQASDETGEGREAPGASGTPGSSGGEGGKGSGAPAGTAPGTAPYEDTDTSTGIEARADAETRPDRGEAASPSDEGAGPLFDAPVPPSSLDAGADIEFAVPDEPPAEAAHARRTMIGRSAEEVDHAPPRGRYAPVPSPETTNASTTLRWAAPAAVLALASAVVVGRALRRRR